MKYASVCSGIEAASVAWHDLGWSADWFAEIEPFPSAVLAHHYPTVPNLGDMTRIADRIVTGEVSAPDVLVGGTPCQSFSISGLRAGLSDHRGALTLEYVRIANAIDAVRSIRGEPSCITLWENVPGVLNSKDNAFGYLLGALAGEDCELVPAGRKWTDAGCVFGPTRAVAWRVLDAQYFGVPQRRERVFVVSSAREGFDPAKILFEPESVRRDSPPCRGPRKTFARHAEIGSGESGERRAFGGGNCSGPIDVATTLSAHGNRQDFDSETFVVDVHAIAFDSRQDPVSSPDVFGALGSSSPQAQSIATESQVRRLTALECERLQGFPDNWTLVPWRGGLAPDTRRYKAIGNSMAVPVMQWIGQRIAATL